MNVSLFTQLKLSNKVSKFLGKFWLSRIGLLNKLFPRIDYQILQDRLMPTSVNPSELMMEKEKEAAMLAPPEKSKTVLLISSPPGSSLSLYRYWPRCTLVKQFCPGPGSPKGMLSYITPRVAGYLPVTYWSRIFLVVDSHHFITMFRPCFQ